MKPLTLAEAAQFLRMSRSNLYQRKDIPRYRRPGSRIMLFDQDELEAWLKQGRMDADDSRLERVAETTDQEAASEASSGAVEFSSPPVYHRNTRYQ
jgi:predicted DNA-binding transcriptional regulator AlpA